MRGHGVENRLTDRFGPTALESELFDFEETDYYRKTMGVDLKLRILAFERMIDPANLAAIKRQTIQWEQEYLASGGHPEERPLNLDPGYLTEAKFVLATTKDRDHRLYLAEGIFAEVTLHFQRGQWRGRDWTYPNYLRDDYRAFLTRCRDHYRRCKTG
jgi:hypothetical protein